MSGIAGVNNRGFTLIEVIVTLVIAAVLGTMLVVFMGTNIAQSVNPLLMTKDQHELNQVMEKVVEKYKAEIRNKSLALPDLLAWVNGLYGAYVDGADTRYVKFDGNAEVPCNRGEPGCYTLKLMLKKNNIREAGIFTE